MQLAAIVQKQHRSKYRVHQAMLVSGLATSSQLFSNVMRVTIVQEGLIAKHKISASQATIALSDHLHQSLVLSIPSTQIQEVLLILRVKLVP